ncbi:hypothetical protein O6H91_01G104800 [Diphasiastrum complanatum]|uniref:Uncharacterized protein n=1 Tax=Diphasiastrum complanatum TaxID=34168 RepID=A0ACC2EU05_DIPCM|nr:hypothetical protein O6H91_01G104800 [Diphasiastrum complanatum]
MSGTGDIECGAIRESNGSGASSPKETPEFDGSREDAYLLELDPQILATGHGVHLTSEGRQNVEFFRQHGKLLGSLAIAAVTLGVLSLIGTILWFTILNPKPLKLQVHSVALQKFLVHFSFLTLSPKVNIMLKFNISLENPNIASFEYENSTAYLSYHGDQFGAAPFPGGMVPAKGKNIVTGSTDIFADNIMRNTHLMSDIAEDIFPMTLFTTISGRINVLHMFHSRVDITANCSVSFAVSTQSIKSFSCIYHTKRSSFGFSEMIMSL